MRKLVDHSYKTVSLYKKIFNDAGLHPDDIKSIEDISKIPVVDKKKMMQYSYNDLISTSYRNKQLIPVKTAGSNGIPFLFYIDVPFDQYRKAQCLRPYITNGRKPWYNSVQFSIHKAPGKKWYQQLGLMKDNYIYSGAPVIEQIKIIQNKKPSVIQGYGSILSLLSAVIIEKNIPMPRPRLVFTDSELLLPEMKENIEKAFGLNVIDIYGTFETDNIAYECCRHEGYHITVDSVIMEFISNGKAAAPGEEGEIVVTVLNNFAMPFVRYNLHDTGSFTDKPCSCGRKFPLINHIKGRSNDYMITADGKKLSFFNIAYFDKLAPNVKEYQIVQEKIDSFTVSVVPGVEYNNQGENIIKPAVKKFFPDAEVIVKIVNSIEREPSGKFKAFKSKVNTG